MARLLSWMYLEAGVLGNEGISREQASAWTFDNLFFPLCGRAVAHTPDNSFMGFVSEELNETEKQLIKDGKASNMAVVYGKEASIWKVSPSKPTANHTGSNAGHTHNTC